MTLADRSRVVAGVGAKGKDAALFAVSREKVARASELRRWKEFLADI